MTSHSPLPRLAPRDLLALRDTLQSAGYSESRVAARAGCATSYQFQLLRDGRQQATTLDDALDVLIRLFFDAEPVTTDAIDGLLGSAVRHQLESLDLVRPTDGGASRETIVWLYPTESVFVASDLPARRGATLAEDVVYPAITSNTRGFVAALPATPCERFLELCAGTGIAALVTAPVARAAWATDVTARATHFARFNALINGLDNVTAVQGDLYEPVAGSTFDRIAAHPPYRAEPERQFIFRDGGADGESVTRRVIAGLPEHLATGGVCYCTCVATDRTDAALEARIRDWLGASHADFDVMVAVQAAWSAREWMARAVADGAADSQDTERRIAAFDELGIERQVLASIVIRRHAGDRPPATVRRLLGSALTRDTIGQMLRWDSELADPDRLDDVMAMRPCIAPETTRHTIERLVDGEWTRSAAHMVRDKPFTLRAEVDAGVASFLARCDGRHTLGEHWTTMREHGLLPPDLDAWRFASVVRSFAASGIIGMTSAKI